MIREELQNCFCWNALNSAISEGEYESWCVELMESVGEVVAKSALCAAPGNIRLSEREASRGVWDRMD